MLICANARYRGDSYLKERAARQFRFTPRTVRSSRVVYSRKHSSLRSNGYIRDSSLESLPSNIINNLRQSREGNFNFSPSSFSFLSGRRISPARFEMRHFRAINLIAFCALVLLARDSDASFSVHGLKKYIPVFLSSPLKELASIRHGIVPGTLWCGPGNISRSVSELGRNQALDACCREHDFCNENIPPEESRYGLYNSDTLCRSSSCECESRFYNCLKKTPGIVAFGVGKVYFRRCQQCFNIYYDVNTCMKKGLAVNEGTDRDGRRVFCAHFDRNPKWGKRRNPASSGSIPTDAPPAWIDGESMQIPKSDFDDDQPAEDDEYDDTYEGFIH